MKSAYQLMNEIEEDSQIKQNHLKNEIVRCTHLIAKYLKIHRDYKEAVVAMWAKKNQTILQKQEYYAGRASSEIYRENPFNLEIKNAVEMKRWIEGDPDLVAMESIIQLTEDCMNKVEMMLDQLKYRPNHIQTILQIRMFEAGA